MNMSFVITKPSICISLDQSTLASRSTFQHQLLNHAVYYHNLSSSKQGPRRRTLTVSSNLQPIPPPIPPPMPSSNPFPGLPGGKGWIAGAIIAFLLPFLKSKWGPLLLLKNEIDKRLQTVEDVVETIEKVADKVEHLAEDVVKDLPEGPLRTAATMIEDVADKVEKAAHLTDEAIDKIQEIEEEVESFVESSNQRKESELIEEKSVIKKQV